MPPPLSIVIIGRNEGERLNRYLQSVSVVRGVVGKVELIYVDSASTDGSPRAVHFDAQVTVLHGRDLDRRTSPERGVATGVRGLHPVP